MVIRLLVDQVSPKTFIEALVGMHSNQCLAHHHRKLLKCPIMLWQMQEIIEIMDYLELEEMSTKCRISAAVARSMVPAMPMTSHLQEIIMEATEGREVMKGRQATEATEALHRISISSSSSSSIRIFNHTVDIIKIIILSNQEKGIVW